MESLPFSTSTPPPPRISMGFFSVFLYLTSVSFTLCYWFRLCNNCGCFICLSFFCYYPYPIPSHSLQFPAFFFFLFGSWWDILKIMLSGSEESCQNMLAYLLPRYQQIRICLGLSAQCQSLLSSAVKDFSPFFLFFFFFN